MAASHSLVKCFCGPGATPLSADAETGGGVMPRLKRNTTTPKDEASKTDRQGRSGETSATIIDDCEDVLLVDAQGHRFGGSVR